MKKVNIALRNLYITLAQAFADVLTMRDQQRLPYEGDLELVCKLARIAPPKGNKPKDGLRGGLARLALALADVHEHPKVSAAIYNQLADTASDVESILRDNETAYAHSSNSLRWHAIAYGPADIAPDAASMFATNEALKAEVAKLTEMLLREENESRSWEARTFDCAAMYDALRDSRKYPPEIEARRADYDRLAESFAALFEMHFEQAPPAFELESNFQGNEQHFIAAFETHWYVLSCELIESMHPRTLRRFYTDMRLWADLLRAERNEAYQEAWKDEGRKQAA